MNGRKAASATQDQPLHQAYILAAVLAVTAATYLGTLKFDFVSDDNLQIADNQYIKSWRNIPYFFRTSVWAHLYPLASHSYYRPIYLFWNMVNYSMFGVNPMGWHATAILMHLVVTAFVYALVRKLAPGRPALAWLTALIFGLHPIHHEVVAWISGATESLYAAFFLAAFLAYLNSRTRSRTAWMCVSCVLYGLAVYTKETAIVLPAMVFAHAWFASGSDDDQKAPSGLGRRLWQATGTALLYVPVTVLYVVMRMKVLSSFGHINVHLSTVELISTWPSILFFYLKHWLLLAGYSAYYDMAYYQGWQLRGVVLPAVVLAGVAAGLWLARGRLGIREVENATVWMIVPLLPALDLGVFHLRELVHDRYFYVPSIGAALLMALLLEPLGRSGARVWGQPRRLVFAGLLLAAVLAPCAIAATNQWDNNLLLLTRAYKYAPQNLALRNDLSATWIEHGDLDKAQPMLESLVREAPEQWQAWINLGRVQYQKKDYSDAERDLRNAITINPDSGIAYVFLGQTEMKTNHAPEALASMRRAVELVPQEYRFHVIYGLILESSGDCPSAITQFAAALTLQAGDEISKDETKRCLTAGSSFPVSQALPAGH